MTIKELEQILEVPRATVRYYEKEGLINPERGSNGYRDYSSEDLERLKKIIIFRKIGISVNDIEDIFDGVKSVNEVLDDNLKNLQRQMNELNGAMNLTRKIQENKEDIMTFNTDVYWNYVDEEENKGNLFFDIAKDLINEEKKTIIDFFSPKDENGRPYSFIGVIVIVIFLDFIFGFGEENIFLDGFLRVVEVLIIECILTVPLYFLGKKFNWINKNRKKSMFYAYTIFYVLLICGILLYYWLF